MQRILIIQNNDAKHSEFYAEVNLSVLYAAVMLLLLSELVIMEWLTCIDFFLTPEIYMFTF